MYKLFKGFIICLVFVFVSNFSMKAEAASAQFVWEKTEIDVPIFSDINDYKNQYVVKFYVNGVESKDFEIEMEVNTTTFSTVLTNKVGRYTVYYKAYSKKYYVSSTQAIVFNVVDITPPTLTLRSDLVTVECGKTLNDVIFYSVSDDTCKKADIKLFLDDSSVQYQYVGIYNAKIKAEDLYGNVVEKDFKVEIIDKGAPQIKILKTPIFNYGEEINFKEYFKCNDDVCGDITDLLVVEGLAENTLGKQHIKLSVSDYSGNMSEIIVEIMIVDKTAPNLVLLQSEITLDIEEFDTYNKDFFKDFVYLISDNYSKKESLLLDVNIENLVKEVADFTVTFTVIDESGNKTEKQILIRLRELVGPTLIVDDVIYLPLASTVDLISYASAMDKYDFDVNERILVDLNNFDPNIEGEYVVTFKCFNTSGVYTEKDVRVVVGEGNKAISNSDDSDLDLTGIITISIIVIIVVGTSVYLIVRRTLKRKRNITRV